MNSNSFRFLAILILFTSAPNSLAFHNEVSYSDIFVDGIFGSPGSHVGIDTRFVMEIGPNNQILSNIIFFEIIFPSNTISEFHFTEEDSTVTWTGLTFYEGPFEQTEFTGGQISVFSESAMIGNILFTDLFFYFNFDISYVRVTATAYNTSLLLGSTQAVPVPAAFWLFLSALSTSWFYGSPLRKGAT